MLSYQEQASDHPSPDASTETYVLLTLLLSFDFLIKKIAVMRMYLELF